LEEFRKALNYSFLLLKYRIRSKKEIYDRLRRKKFSPHIIKKTLDFLKSSGYIDDDLFASVFVKEKLNKGCGKRRIYFELKRLGINSSLIKKEIESINPDIYKDIIQKIIDKRYSRYKDSKNKRGKIIRYLYSRGFTREEIEDALNEYK